MAMYASYLALGHTLLVKSIKATTMMRYLKAAALLCEPGMLVSPLVSCCSKKSAWVEAIISEQRRWESMSNRQEPLTVDMILHVCNLATRQGEDSLMEALRDWLIIGIYTGNRKSEWVQEHQNSKKGYLCSMGYKEWGGGFVLPKPSSKKI
eukprot:1757842-Ditylum_brightwellii.AAC.1